MIGHLTGNTNIMTYKINIEIVQLDLRYNYQAPSSRETTLIEIPFVLSRTVMVRKVPPI